MEIVELDHATLKSMVFFAKSKGLVYFWACFIYFAPSFGYIWHGISTLFINVFPGIDLDLNSFT